MVFLPPAPFTGRVVITRRWGVSSEEQRGAARFVAAAIAGDPFRGVQVTGTCGLSAGTGVRPWRFKGLESRVQEFYLEWI